MDYLTMGNTSFLEDPPAASSAAAAAARDRQKKSSMACEMCRKRKATPRFDPAPNSQVKVILEDVSQLTCNFCAKYSFQCIVNTARKRRGPRPRVSLALCMIDRRNN